MDTLALFFFIDISINQSFYMFTIEITCDGIKPSVDLSQIFDRIGDQMAEKS